MDARRIDASGSAEPMSGLNPDEMDGEGAAFAKRRQQPRRKSQMASRGMEGIMRKTLDVLLFIQQSRIRFYMMEGIIEFVSYV